MSVPSTEHVGAGGTQLQRDLCAGCEVTLASVLALPLITVIQSNWLSNSGPQPAASVSPESVLGTNTQVSP